MKKCKVLIIDDSAVIRQTLDKIISLDARLEVIGTASNPYYAVKIIKKNLPDVITLDIEMPRMDGITFLKTLMAQHPIPVVVISSLTERGSSTAFQALQHGAVEILCKPKIGNNKVALEEASIEICDTVMAASLAQVNRISYRQSQEKKVKEGTPPLPPKLSTAKGGSMLKTTNTVVAVGASTGGTEALRIFLEGLPYDAPGTVIVQHMPAQFTKSFAERLNTICRVTVKEAKNGDPIIPGTVLIAPGNYHMRVKRSGARYFVKVDSGNLVNRHRPSVDVLFDSVAKYVGKNSIGVLLTGMGADGAKGLLEMKKAGGKTIAQDEASSVVFGMPKEAIKLQAADRVIPLLKISSVVLSWAGNLQS
mgnify:CR=1 FL=1